MERLKLSKKSFKVLSFAIIIIAAVWLGGFVFYQSKSFEEPTPPKTISPWKVYQNNDYKFEIEYPDNWDYAEKRDVESPGNALKYVIEFGPKNKNYEDGISRPLSISVIEGTLGDYKKIVPDFNSFGESLEEPLKKFYGFKSREKNVRIVIEDGSDLFPGSVSEKKEIKTNIKKMISTFNFLD